MSTEIERRRLLQTGAAGIAGLGLASLVDVQSAAAEETPAAAVEESRVVFRVSEQVVPGDVVVLYGGKLADVKSVRVVRLDGVAAAPPSDDYAVTALPGGSTVSTLQPNDNSVKFVLPHRIGIGVYGVDFGGDRIAVINRAEPRWVQATKFSRGLGVNEFAPGDNLQIIGRNLTLRGLAVDRAKAGVRVILVNGSGSVIPAKLVSAEPYSVTVETPRSLPAGSYRVRIHNGGGGQAGWSDALTVTVKQPITWPSREYNIKDFGAKGDNMTDDSAAVKAAFDAIEANGGGILRFPHGKFRVSGWFRIPEKTVIRGDGMDATYLQWPLENPRTLADIAPAVLYGNGSYEIEGISIVANRAYTVLYDLSFAVGRKLPAPIPEMAPYMKPFGATRDVFLRRARIFNYFWQGRPRVDDPRAPDAPNGDYHDNAFLESGVTNVEVTNCDINGSMKIVNSDSVRMTDTIIRDGMWALAWVQMGTNYTVLERNTYDKLTPGFGTMQQAYVAHNFSDNLMQAERESMVFDINSLIGYHDRLFDKKAPWQGWVASSTDVKVTLKDAALTAKQCDNLAILIVAGKGAGQSRIVASTQTNGVTVAKPWDVIPDATSVAMIYTQTRDVILYANEAQNTSCFGEFYGHGFDSVIAANTVRRDNGSWAFAGYFLQWIDNDFQSAMPYYSYIGPRGYTGEITPEYNATFAAVGCCARGNFTIEMNPNQIKVPYPYVRGATVRNNRMALGHRILMMHGYGGPRTTLSYVALEDVVIEHNKISKAPIGIEIDANVNRALLSGNEFTEVPNPTKLWDATKVQVI